MKFLPPAVLRYEDKFFRAKFNYNFASIFKRIFGKKPKTKEFDFAFLGFGAPQFNGLNNQIAVSEFNDTVLRGIAKPKQVIEAYPPLPFAFSN